jgi:tetratricopeptide (TPR) repeat protein
MGVFSVQDENLSFNIDYSAYAMSSDIHELPPPSDSTAFESLCLDLFKDIWKNPSAQKNGRRGQDQDGIDIFGQSDGKWVGVQCKQKDGLLRTSVTPKELEEEVSSACNFKPALHHFILTTTGPRDAKVQERARQLSDEHQLKGLFTIEVQSWREIWPELSRRTELLKRIGALYWPHLFQKALSAIHQLPPLPTLVGRDEELTNIEKQITSSSKWIGLQGMGGVGKTALAVASAHRLKDLYPDAQIYYDLRGADNEKRLPVKSADVMRFVVRAFYPTASFPEAQDDLTALYRSVLNDGGRVLLLFDNAVDADQIRPLLPPPNCILIVTSRKYINLPDLIKHKIDCLIPDKSQELLVTHAPRIKGCEKEAAELCGNLPLALLVVAGIVNYHTISEPKQLLADLRKRRKKLDAVDAAFQVSYDLLSEELRLHWCLLSVFPGSFNVLAATAIWGKISYPPDFKDLMPVHAASQAETSQDLQALINTSLVEWNVTSQRFRLHNLIRQFCNSKLSIQQRIESHYCHSAHFFEVLRQANQRYKSGGENTARGLAIFDSELTNIGYGHGWAIDSFRSVNFSHDRPQMKRAVAVACSAYPCIGAALFSLRLSPLVRISIGDAGLRAAKEIGDRAAEGSHLGNIGVGYVELGEYKKAISLFKQRFGIARELNDFSGECNALGNLAGAHSNLGEYEMARDYCENELNLRRKHGDRRGEGLALCSLGVIYAGLGKYDKAIELYDQQTQIAREGEFLHDEAVALLNMGTAYRGLGKSQKAIECLERGITICRQLRDIKTEGNCLTNLANVYAGLNEPQKAVEIYKQSIRCKQAVGDIRGIASTSNNLGRAYLQLNDYAQSLTHAENALHIYEQIHDPAAHKMQEIITATRKLIQTKASQQFMEMKNMHYYSYHVKMQDLRGGFPGFLSKSKPAIVDGIAHLLVQDKTKYSEQQIKSIVLMLDADMEIIKPDISRPFTGEEYEQLPHKFKDQLHKGGYCLTAIPYFSAALKPFGSNS